MKVFISCRFDSSTKSPIECARAIFKLYGIDAFVSGEVEAEPLSENIRKHIRGSDVFFAIVTKKDNVWIHNEIGIAYEAGIPIYAIIENGFKEGILKYIITYKSFELENQDSIINAISEVARKINESRIEEDNPEIYRLFKSKRERIIYNIGVHAAAEQVFLLLDLHDFNPNLYEVYKSLHHNELERFKKELELLQ